MLRTASLLLAALLIASCARTPETTATSVAPLPSRGGAPRDVAANPLAATAHPLATTAALAMLERGGAPIDAAVAAQMVLGLVEPQSSGVGGGSLVMHWDAATGQLRSFDGLASAPALAPPRLRSDGPGMPLDPSAAVRGGRSVGVPGTLPALKLVHDRYGKLPWKTLFEPAIEAAERGFPLAPYLHRVLSRRDAAAHHPEMALYFGADGRVLPVGTTLRNPEYARTMRRVADLGPEGLLADGGADRIVAATRRGYRPSAMTEADLRSYRAVEREPLCAPFIAYTVCTAGPPSFGGVRMLQIVRVAERLGGGRYDFSDPAFAHLFLEASRRAMADRDRWAADPDHHPVPARDLVSDAHIATQAATIGRVADGKAAALDAAWGAGDMTSQMAIVDAAGNAISITTTINLDFGSRLMVDGFVLNNAMSLFSDASRTGRNAVAPGARGVTSMAPTIAFDRDGRPVLVGGAAGGTVIPEYVAAAVIEILGNRRSPGEALSRGNLSAAIAPGKTRLESGTASARLAPGLRALGHDVEQGALLSGAAFLARTPAGWIGAADPRRDGNAR